MKPGERITYEGKTYEAAPEERSGHCCGCAFYDEQRCTISFIVLMGNTCDDIIFKLIETDKTDNQ